MSELCVRPEGTFTSEDNIYVPVERMPEHPLLRFASLDSEGALIWPSLYAARARCVQDVHVVRRDEQAYVAIPPRINFDLFVDETTAPLGTIALYDDIQRYYTRFTDTQFLHVGTYTAVTIDGVRHYFAWRSGDWDELDVGIFVHAREADDIHFAETGRADIIELSPGALEKQPRPESFLDAYFGRDPDDDMYQQGAK